MAKLLPPMPIQESMLVHRGWIHVIPTAMPAMMPERTHQQPAQRYAQEPVFFPSLQETPRIIQLQLLEASVVRSHNAQDHREGNGSSAARTASPRVNRFSQSGYRPLHLCYQAHPASPDHVGKPYRQKRYSAVMIPGVLGLCLLLIAVFLYHLTTQ